MFEENNPTAAGHDRGPALSAKTKVDASHNFANLHERTKSSNEQLAEHVLCLRNMIDDLAGSQMNNKLCEEPDKVNCSNVLDALHSEADTKSKLLMELNNQLSRLRSVIH